MRWIPAQLDIGPLVGLALGETEAPAHLETRLIVDHHLDSCTAAACSPLLHQRASDGRAEPFRLMLRRQQEIDEINDSSLSLLDEASTLFPFKSDNRIDRVWIHVS